MATTTPKAKSPGSKEDSPTVPVYRCQSGRVSAAVFVRKIGKREAYSVSVRRSYRRADGSWQNTFSLDEADLPDATNVMQKCMMFIGEQPVT